MILNKVLDHYRQHLSRMVKQSTREDYNKRLAMLSELCAIWHIHLVANGFLTLIVKPHSFGWCDHFVSFILDFHNLCYYPIFTCRFSD